MKSKTVIGLMLTFACGVATGLFLLRDVADHSFMISATAQQPGGEPAKPSPTKARAGRDVYFPGTEDLEPDEMRITALGTGMPSARPKQAAACFLVELGNGDKFLFDIGSGSHERIAAQKIPYDYLVWNVTKDSIKVRMAAKDEEVWPSPPIRKKNPPDFRDAIPMSEFTLSGRQPYPEVVKPIYDEINEIYGTDFKPGL